jgi:hypothetical protein
MIFLLVCVFFFTGAISFYLSEQERRGYNRAVRRQEAELGMLVISIVYVVPLSLTNICLGPVVEVDDMR